MSLPATASGRWFTASLNRHLSATLPDLTLDLGPITTFPSPLPALVLQLMESETTHFLGGRISTVGNERGVLLTQRFWGALLAEPATWQRGAGDLFDRLQVALIPGVIPWISEEEAGTPIQHGTLAVEILAANAVPAPDTAAQLVRSAPCDLRILNLAVSGTLAWIEGVSP